jgi:hypothetical protein
VEERETKRKKKGKKFFFKKPWASSLTLIILSEIDD